MALLALGFLVRGTLGATSVSAQIHAQQTLYSTGVTADELAEVMPILERETNLTEEQIWHQYEQGILEASWVGDDQIHVHYCRRGGGMGQILIEVNF